MVSILSICLILSAVGLLAAADPPTLEKAVATGTEQDLYALPQCAARRPAGSTSPASRRRRPCIDDRAGWDRILDKVRSGEMPPKGVPPARRDRCGGSDTSRASSRRPTRNIKPDPGRVTARRLNRNEYSNTIRDLLGVDFRAEKNFPTDDSGNGFDNIGDVLTISPVLMEKYLSAAGAHRLARHRRRSAAQEAARDRSTTPRTRRSAASTRAPSKPRIASSSTASTPSASACRASAARTPSPSQLGFWMDGKLLHTMPVGDQALRAGLLQSVLGRGDAPVPAGRRSRLPRRLHRRRFRQDVSTDKDAYNRKKNKFLDSITFVGPFAVEGREGQPQEDPDLRSEYRRGLRREDRLHPGAPRLPPAGDQGRSRVADEVRRAWRRPRARSTEQGIQLAHPGDAGFAALPLPHRARPEPDRRRPKSHPISDVELASRLSYFLWSSMPDDELLGAGRSRQAARARRARRAGEAHAGRPAVRRARRQLRRPVAGDCATSTSSSPIRRSSRSGAPNCATP